MDIPEFPALMLRLHERTAASPAEALPAISAAFAQASSPMEHAALHSLRSRAYCWIGAEGRAIRELLAANAVSRDTRSLADALRQLIYFSSRHGPAWKRLKRTAFGEIARGARGRDSALLEALLWAALRRWRKAGEASAARVGPLPTTRRSPRISRWRSSSRRGRKQLPAVQDYLTNVLRELKPGSESHARTERLLRSSMPRRPR